MKTKRIWRYSCDFCGKSNCSKPSIEKHEKRCTLNPNRNCGVCGLLDQPQPKLTDLIAALPTRDLTIADAPGAVSPLTEQEMKTLRTAAGNCPACIMAALRQGNIPIPCAFDFDFKKELDAIWNEFWEEKNNAALEEEQAYYR